MINRRRCKALRVGFTVSILGLNLQMAQACDSFECAVLSQDLTQIEQFLKAGANPNALVAVEGVHRGRSFVRHRPAIQYAISHRNEELALLLLQHGANPRYSLTDPQSTLISAVDFRMGKLLRFIVENKLEDLNYAGEHYRFNPLASAVSISDTQTIDYLLDAGADPNYFDAKLDLLIVDSALAEGSEHVVRLLIDEGLAFNDAKRSNYQTVQLSAKSISHPLIKTLANLGLDYSDIDSQYDSAAFYARSNCRHQERVLRVFAQIGVDFCAPDSTGKNVLESELFIREHHGNSFLSDLSFSLIENAVADSCSAPYSQKLGDLQARARDECVGSSESDLNLECLINANALAQEDLQDDQWRSTRFQYHSFSLNALELSLAMGRQDSAITLLTKMDQHEFCNVEGMPILHRAISLGQFRVVNYILWTGAGETNPLVCSAQSGFSDLHLAVLNLDYERVLSLLSSGMGPDVADRFGFTPLAWSLALSADDIAFALIEEGADVRTKTRYEQNMLHFAAIGDSGVLRGLGLHQALDIHQRDSIDGRTPYLAAIASECISNLGSTYRDKKTVCVADRYDRTSRDYVLAGFYFGEKRTWVRAIQPLAEQFDVNTCGLTPSTTAPTEQMQ